MWREMEKEERKKEAKNDKDSTMNGNNDEP